MRMEEVQGERRRCEVAVSEVRREHRVGYVA